MNQRALHRFYIDTDLILWLWKTKT